MTWSNEAIADEFDTLADLLEIQGANGFRVRAYRSGARTIRGWLQPLADRLADPTFDPMSIEGIGEAMADKLRSLITTGSIPQLDELRGTIPAGVLDLMRVPGVGAKKAAALYGSLGIDSLDALESACREGRLRTLKGFSAKTESSILEGLAIARSAQDRRLRAEVEERVEHLRTALAGPEIRRLEFAGSFRRGRETVGDLDIVAVADDGGHAVMDRLAAFDAKAEILARGETKMSVRLSPPFQIDLRIVPAESFGAALQYFTGSTAHNVRVRSEAKRRGLKVNEWGVFRVAEDGTETRIAGADESEIYAALDWPVIPPELREDRFEFDDGRPLPVPDLIRLEQLRGDLHMHTTATDGTASIDEMARAAHERGLDYIAITDHSRRVTMARGLDPERLAAQWREVAEADRRWSGEFGFRILKGIECDILEDGELDLPDELLAQADWVVASVHYGQQQSREQITDRILRAVRNPTIDAIAHPTGRLLLRREPYEVDLESVMQACVEFGKALELNANPHRLDLDDVRCARCRELGIPVVIDSDAHTIAGLDVLRHGILQARRGGLAAEHVLNTRSADEIARWRTGRSGG